MKFVEVEPDELVIRRRRSTKEVIAFLDEFIASGYHYAKVTDIPAGRKVNNVVTNLHASIKRYGYAIKVHQNNGTIYLERIF